MANKGKVFVKGYAVVDDTRVVGRGGAQASNDTPSEDKEQSVIGKRAKGKVVYVNGSDSKELGSIDVSFAADVKDKERDAKVKSEVDALVVAAGLEPTDITYEK